MSGINSLVKFYVVGSIPSSVQQLFKSLGIQLTYIPLEGGLARATKLEDNSVVVINTRDAGLKPLNYYYVLTRLLDKASNYIIVLVNKDPKARDHSVLDAHASVFKVLSQVYGKTYEPVMVCDPSDETLWQPREGEKPSGCRLHPAVVSADAVAYYTRPPGTVVVENLDENNAASVVVFILKAYLPNSVFTKLATLLPRDLVPSTSIKEGPSNMVPLGTVGWITNYTRGRTCGEITGYQSFYIRYFYGNITLATGTLYHVFYAYAVHSGKGYQTTCWWSTINHYPRVFETVIYWKTDTYPGQVLDDWGPKNAGSQRVITYTVSAGMAIGKDFSATIEYSTGFTEPNAPYYTWMDLTDPPLGKVKVRHIVERGGWPEDRLNDVLFTVEPSSYGYLDPNKPGGYLPMVVYHSMYMELNTGDSTNVTIAALLRTNSYDWWFTS
ncbi:hypothetical protein DKAM_0090 [Desulfurococcus amylolyticus 1221n]|uniref:Uncharacterized protein n=1 Tax=Desulfurococcus amylolyticus (strain DSM 18924 / JCM 16383 / VKM B-2413 / 1221n) TaxID=490899 RepID=B8D2P8_DESA1|nr:hypothetical protein DKAM_0090 [Desulfurococcus amylolyticus 1221n]